MILDYTNKLDLNSCYPAVEGVLAAKLGLVLAEAILPVYVFMPSWREGGRGRDKGI